MADFNLLEELLIGIVEHYDKALVVGIAFNYALSDKTSKLENFVNATTAALAVDSIIVPWVTNGKTFHEYFGLSPQFLHEFYIQFYERLGVGVGGLLMAIRNYTRNTKK